MTLKEFLEKNPSAIQEAEKCKDMGEFKKLTEKAGITFDSEDKLQKAFELVKNKNVTELSEDTLDSVSGGKVYEHDYNNVAFNKKGYMLTPNKGKKVSS